MMAARCRPAGLTLRELLDGHAVVDQAGADLLISGVALDSRRVRPGDLFLACQGTREHGLAHARQAIEQGAVAVAWEPVEGLEPLGLSVPAVPVAGLGERAGVIAARFFGHPSRAMTVIGVTGTDGKTSVSQFLAQALDQDGARCGVIGTLGYGLWGDLIEGGHTTPDAVTLQAELAGLRRQGARWLSMEVSSHALAQGRVNGIAFDHAIFTNLSRDHLDYHGSVEAYAAAKRRLFEWAGLEFAILNLDDAFGQALRGALRGPRILGYGLAGPGAYAGEVVTARCVDILERGVRAEVHTPWGVGELEAAVLGRFNVLNLLAVLASLLALGIEMNEALLRLRRVRTVPGRMEPFGGHGRPVAVVDYAHTPAALEHVLTALREHCQGRLWCVFGCGGERDRGKRPLMAQAAERLADAVIVTDDNPRGEDGQAIVQEILAGFVDPAAVTVERDRAAAIGLALSRAQAGDVVLVAGKGHEDYQIVGAERRAFSDRRLVAELLGEVVR